MIDDSNDIGIFMFGLSVLVYHYYHRNNDLTTAVSVLNNKLTHAMQLRDEERKGRINIEQRNRLERLTKESSEGYHFRTIGIVESPYVDRRGTPRQPILVHASRSIIRLT